MSYPVKKPADGTFQKKNGEHSNAAYEGEETNTTLSSSDTSNASSEPYADFSADNLAYIRDSGSYTDINTPKSSINSNSGKIDVTTDKPGTPAHHNENGFPNFNNRYFNTPFNQQRKTTDRSRHDSRTGPRVFCPSVYVITGSPITSDNNEVTLNEENEEDSNTHQTRNGSTRHNITTWPMLDRPTIDEVLSSITLDNEDARLNNENEDNDQNFKGKKKKCNWRKWIIIIFVCSCLSVVAALIVQNEYGSKKETPDDPPTQSLIVDKCENDISTATVGEQICIPYTQQFTSNPSGIQVKQVSSQYFSALPSFYINVSADTVSQKKEDWIINYNISRPDQPLRFMKENATCDSIGIYEITIEYEDGNVTSFKFEISFGDPQLEQSVTRLNDKVYVHCEMKKTCMASSLALFVNDGGSSRLIPDIDVCSFTDKNSGTTVSAEAILHVSQLSENHTISCVPLMTNMELSANLTSTSGIPVCEGDCVPDCKDDPQGEAYFPDKNDCSKFHQCSNGQLVSQSCSPSTYWSTRKCTCLHFDDDICNRDTKRFLSPLLSIEKCTNASLV